jgi:hypothetical protein
MTIFTLGSLYPSDNNEGESCSHAGTDGDDEKHYSPAANWTPAL